MYLSAAVFPELTLESLNWSNIIAVISLILAIWSFVYSRVVNNRNKWGMAMQFLAQFDSKEMRSDRKLVYDYYNKPDSDMKKVGDSPEVEAALSRMIAFYDGNSRLVLEGLMPKTLFDDTTLFTAANFYVIAQPYMEERRNSQGKKANKMYAYYYAKLMASDFSKKRMEKINKSFTDDGCQKLFSDAFNNAKIMKHDAIDESVTAPETAES